jgi:hypothetical protein
MLGTTTTGTSHDGARGGPGAEGVPRFDKNDLMKAISTLRAKISAQQTNIVNALKKLKENIPEDCEGAVKTALEEIGKATGEVDESEATILDIIGKFVEHMGPGQTPTNGGAMGGSGRKSTRRHTRRKGKKNKRPNTHRRRR